MGAVQRIGAISRSDPDTLLDNFFATGWCGLAQMSPEQPRTGSAGSVVVKRPHPVTGVLWALGLEAAMALLYPSFLIIKQYGEFLTMSVLGHVCYGLVIGAWARHRLADGSDQAGTSHPRSV